MMEQSQLHTKKILILVFLLAIVGIGLYFVKNKGSRMVDLNVNKEKKCVSDGLEVFYPRDPEKTKIGYDRPLIPIDITVKSNSNIINNFTVDNVPPNQDAFDFRDCNLYVSRYWGFDYKSGKFDSNVLFQIWKYPYLKGGIPVEIVTTLKKVDGIEKIYFHSEFSVSNSEKYISLIQGYVGSDNYVLHIKDIDTKENVVEVNLTNDLFKKYPNVSGDVEFRGWTEDEKYFWFSLFDQANVLAYVKVNMADSSYEVFEAPAGTMNQDAFNMNTGWVTYDDGPPWTGMQEFDQEYQEEWDADNKKVNFYLYNLFTKEQLLLDSQSDVTFWHYPKWLDDETLEYKVSSGEVKTYTLK